MKTKLITALFATIALSGCGGDGGGLKATGSATGLFAAGGAPFALTSFGTFLESNPMTTLPDDLAGNAAPFMAGLFDHCKSFLIGTSDTDDHFKIKYDCKDVATNDGPTSWLGTREAKVVDSNDFSKGYRQDYDLTYESENTAFGSYFYNEYKGFNDFKVVSGGHIFESDFKARTVLIPHDPEVDWTTHRQIYSAYLPDDEANPSASGEVVIDAFFMLKGKIGGGPNGEDYGITNVTFKVKSENLRYDDSCTKAYDSGSITYADGSGGKVTVVYNCNSLQATWNGTTITW